MPRNTLVINCDIRETRVALIEEGIIAELQIERAAARGTVGNIVLGRVTRVLPGMQAAFIDVGMGLELVDGSLGGILRVTTSTSHNRAQARRRISLTGGGEKDVYSSNIQVADLNALNAVLAIVKWKKLIGFYRDLEGELHCTYTTDGNMLLNGGDEG